MLSAGKLYAVVPANDLERAKKFYKEKLGFEPAEEKPEGLIYASNGSTFLVYVTDGAGTAQNTAMGWRVDDLEAEMEELRTRGVVFEEYDMPGLKTVNGIVEDDEERAAWFKDSEGNILCVSQSKV